MQGIKECKCNFGFYKGLKSGKLILDFVKYCWVQKQVLDLKGINECKCETIMCKPQGSCQGVLVEYHICWKAEH